MKKLLALLCLGLLLFATGCPPAPTGDNGGNGDEPPIIVDDTVVPDDVDDVDDVDMDEEPDDTAETPADGAEEEVPPEDAPK